MAGCRTNDGVTIRFSLEKDPYPLPPRHAGGTRTSQAAIGGSEWKLPAYTQRMLWVKPLAAKRVFTLAFLKSPLTGKHTLQE
jgi:hypothetical protein